MNEELTRVVLSTGSTRSIASIESIRSIASTKQRREAADAEARLRAQAATAFDEFLILRFRATNEPPYPFEWSDYDALLLEYNALLARVAREYDKRF